MLRDQLKDLVSQSMSEAPPQFYCLFIWDEMTWHKTDMSLILQVIELLQAMQDKFPAHMVRHNSKIWFGENSKIVIFDALTVQCMVWISK